LQNADDGWDFWEGPSVRLENCWSWENGFDDQGNHLGDGNGYKLGRGGGGHTLINCLAWKNYARGFDFNNSQADILYNNTAWNNGTRNFMFINYAHILKNNLSVSPGDIRTDGQTIDEYNSWNNPPGVTVTNADFLSLDDAIARSPRQADGNLPESNFLKLRSDSDSVDAGTNVGLPFNGAAPDLGAFETGGAPNSTATPTSQSLAGDVDEDGDVNTIDMRLVIKAWGTEGSLEYEQREDTHPDGKVNMLDAAKVVGNWAP
jgi:hypothetical protein